MPMMAVFLIQDHIIIAGTLNSEVSEVFEYTICASVFFFVETIMYSYENALLACWHTLVSVSQSDALNSMHSTTGLRKVFQAQSVLVFEAKSVQKLPLQCTWHSVCC